MLEFNEFPKMPRLNREIIITEKIDGTNAQVLIVPRIQVPPDELSSATAMSGIASGNFFEVGDNFVLVGSRTRWISPKDDNYGFARWVYENRDEIIKLGPGRWFGEWWGVGIQRHYDMSRKVFSLFNVRQWKALHTPVGTETGYTGIADAQTGELGPSCVGVVPTLYRGNFSEGEIFNAKGTLINHGSRARPGFMDPEGIIVYHLAAQHGFKITLKNDDKAKSEL
jgi:hypothetical protein